MTEPSAAAEIEMDVLSPTYPFEQSPNPVEMYRDEPASSYVHKKESSWKSYNQCMCFTYPKRYGKNQKWWWVLCCCCCACYLCFCLEFLLNTLLRALQIPPLCQWLEKLLCCWVKCPSCERPDCCDDNPGESCAEGCVCMAECLGMCCIGTCEALLMAPCSDY